MKYQKAKMSNGLTSIELISDHEQDAWFFRKLEDKGIKLNEGQIEFVRHFNGPALIAACAGAGKSSTLVSRLSYLDQVKGVDLANVLLISFTKQAATEIIAKATKLGLASKKELSKVTAGTFHSVFLKIIRENGEDREILSSDKSKQITIKMIMKSLNIGDNKYKPEDILAFISGQKNQMAGLEEYGRSQDCNLEFYQVWKKYEEYKRSNQKIDFDDMLTIAYQLLKEKEDVLHTIRKRFKYIMIDESQDTNMLQFALVEMIAHPNNNLTIVGDPNQTIFSFSGAKIENMVNFPKRYPDSKIIRMNTNYRCVAPILGIANHAIQKNSMKIDGESFAAKDSDIYPTIKMYENTDHEAEEIVKYIKEKYESGERKYSDFAVLFRNNSNSRAIFEELLMNEIPFTTSNSDDVFYENATVKPLLAYLKVMVDPYNFNAIGEILPTLYIKKDKIVEIGKLQKKQPLSRPIEHVLSFVTNQYAKRKTEDKLLSIKRMADYKPIVVLKHFRDDYEKYLLGEDKDDSTTLHREITKEILDELENSSKKFSTVSDYIRFVERVIKNSKAQKESKGFGNKDTVKLMTIHKSKGLEFTEVFSLSLNEGVIPHRSALEDCTDTLNRQYAIEEENRLFYVLCTRAEENLHLSFTRTFRNKEAQPSRFIVEHIDFDYEVNTGDQYHEEEEDDEEEMFDLWFERQRRKHGLG